MFKSLHLHNWRQFDNVEIDFHERLTILTGANGTGKTTILHLLNRHWGWKIPYVSSPLETNDGYRQYWAGFWGHESSEPLSPKQSEYEIGTIECDALDTTYLYVVDQVSETFQVNFNPFHRIPGVYVSSHRPLYRHKKLEQIPAKVDAKKQIFNSYLDEIKRVIQGGASRHSPCYRLKQSLVSLAMFGYGNAAVVPDEDARITFEGFQSVLQKLLPTSLGFRRIRIEVPDVILETSTGNIALDSVSGGIASLIDIAWQIYLYSLLEDEFVVVIDEPEAHLHPELQRIILPQLLEAFPKVQFVVATHNPFVIGSTNESSVYVLKYSDKGINELPKVESVLLNQVNKAGTSDDILREALGLESTKAVWVVDRLSEIINKHKDKTLDQSTLNSIRNDLELLGLGQYVPETMSKILDANQPI